MKILLTLLALSGLALSITSLYEHVSLASGFASAPAFCNLGGDFNCELVLGSSWSTIFGIPLAVYGITFYIALVLIALLASAKLIEEETSQEVLFFLTLLSSFLSIFLFLISKFSIGAFCLLCIGMYITNFLLLLVCILEKKKAGFFKSALQGFTKIMDWLGAVCGAGKHTSSIRAQARLLLIGLFVLFFSANALADLLFVRFVYPEDKVKQVLSAHHAEGVLKEWKTAPKEKFSIRSDSPLTADYAKGPKDARVQIVEFTDYECPMCRLLYIKLEDIIKTYNKDVQLVIKNFPLDSSCNESMTQPFHRHACFAAEYSRCAGEQGKFWEISDYVLKLDVFNRPKAGGEVEAAIREGGALLNLDEAALEECMTSDRQLKKIKEDIKEGDALGVEGTPTVWINGKRLKNPGPQAIVEVIKEVLG